MPVAASGIAKRYAEAVFEIAKDHGTFDKWSKDLEAIARVQQNPQTAMLLAAPALGLPSKEALLADLLAGVSPEAANLVKLLLRKGRFALTPQIAESYRRKVNDHLGIATAEVTSAVPLKAEELEAVTQRLATITGRQVVVHLRVDPSIIGGVVARIGDQLIDGSVRGRLEALKKQLGSSVATSE